MSEDYSILGQRQNVEINPAGTGFEEVWDITYKVLTGPSKGTVATITVPDADHNAAYIKNAIEDKIKTLGEVASLGKSGNAKSA